MANVVKEKARIFEIIERRELEREENGRGPFQP
jgi:hypothetical protein